MCRVDGWDQVALLTNACRKSRKQHVCDECYRFIVFGEKYRYETYATEGTVYVHKTCAHCQVGRDWLVKNCGGYIYGEVLDEVHEHADEYPDLRGALGAACAGMKTKWAVDGALMPVPDMPPAISIHQ